MIIAITGTIGSGKSTVCSILSSYGYKVIDCDALNADLLCDDKYIKSISDFFPEVVDNGQINKKALSNMVFNDEEKRLILNSIAHPAIRAKLLDKLKVTKGTVFVEIPLFDGSGMEDLFDQVWVVICDRSIQINRVMARGKTKVEAESILNIQSSIIKYNIPTIIINNVGDIESLRTQIKNLL